MAAGEASNAGTVERPARRAGQVAVDQRLELGSLDPGDARQIRAQVGDAAGAILGDELLEQSLHVRHLSIELLAQRAAEPRRDLVHVGRADPVDV